MPEATFEYWRVTLSGGHRMYAFFAPALTMQAVAALYPKAQVKPLTKDEWMKESQ